MGSAFYRSANALDGERAEFARIACELERIAAWLHSQDANSEQAQRLSEQAQQIRTDSHLPPR
jgi:hypothetical protein